MKIFGIKFETKKDLKNKIAELMNELETKAEAFPFTLGQVVFDIALKNEKGRYTKIHPSFEYSTITPVTVNEKNYFNLVKRFENNDVFTSQTEALAHLKSVCK